MLCGSDCNDNRLRDVTGDKRGDTVGVGWEDKKGLHGRREWARLPLRHFELACGMDNMQVLRGLKRAIQRGYILRRPRLDSFEYAIRWADSSRLSAEKDSLEST